jgi:two-component system, NtrC family, sensor kinase
MTKATRKKWTGGQPPDFQRYSLYYAIAAFHLVVALTLFPHLQPVGMALMLGMVAGVFGAGYRLLNEIELQRRGKDEAIARYHQAQADLLAQSQQLEQIQQTPKLIQTEKMISLGRLVAGVAHEINNPVNFIYGNLIHASRSSQGLLNLVAVYQQHYPESVPAIRAVEKAIELEYLVDDLPKMMASMSQGAERIRAIVLCLRNFSRLDEADMKLADIHEGINNTLLLLQHRIKTEAREIQIVKDYRELPLVECYPGQLNQVLMNLLTNAIDALEEKLEGDGMKEMKDQSVDLIPYSAIPTITIRTEALRSGYVRVCIADNGVGMNGEVRSRLYDPFFTTKPVGSGTGLGLTIGYQIITEKHGGKIYCNSAPGQGAEFAIEIPVEQISIPPTSRYPVNPSGHDRQVRPA